MSSFVDRTKQVRPGTRIKDNSPKAPSRRIHRRAPIKTDPASLAATCRIPNPESASQLRRIPCCHRYRFPPQPGLCPVELPSPIRRSTPVVRSLNRSEPVGRKPMVWRNLSDGAARRGKSEKRADCRPSTSEQRSCGDKSGQRTEAADSFRPNLQPLRSPGNCGMDTFTCQPTHHELTRFLVKHSFTLWSKRSPRSAIRRG